MTMGTRQILFILFFAAGLMIVALVLFFLKINPAVSVSLPTETMVFQELQEQPTITYTQIVETAFDEAEPTPSPEKPLPDAQALLQSRCTRCHMMVWLNQVKLSRSEWETILVRMESFNVNLSEQERTVLLDYLAVENER